MFFCFVLFSLIRTFVPNMKLIKGEFKEKLDLLLAPTIRAGFPSPAEDYLSDSLDFNRDLIRHPEATFYGRVEGDSMIGLGIDEGDIAVIDRKNWGRFSLIQNYQQSSTRPKIIDK